MSSSRFSESHLTRPTTSSIQTPLRFGGSYADLACRDSASEELPQGGRQLLRSLLRDEVTRSKRASADVAGPTAPDIERPIRHGRLLPTPVNEHRASDLPAGLAVLGVHLAVDVERRPVVGAHPRDRLRGECAEIDL